MQREIITPRDESHWLELRRQDITSTQSAALFGLSPYVTRFELYHLHRNGIEVPFVANDRTGKGKRMEWAIAEEAALQEGWTGLKPLKDYIRDPASRMGASFDYEAVDADGRPLLVEIKMVDYFRYRDLWVDNEAPEHIETQVQHQMEVADRFERAAIVAWSGTYDCNVLYRDRDRDFGRALRSAVEQFWRDVADGNEPAVDYARDEKVIAAMFRSARGEPVDLTDDEAMDLLAARFERAKASASEFEKEAAALKAEIHHRLANAPGGYTSRYKITAGWTKDTPDRPADPGEIIKGRKGYRQCLVKPTTR